MWEVTALYRRHEVESSVLVSERLNLLTIIVTMCVVYQIVYQCSTLPLPGPNVSSSLCRDEGERERDCFDLTEQRTCILCRVVLEVENTLLITHYINYKTPQRSIRYIYNRTFLPLPLSSPPLYRQV